MTAGPPAPAPSGLRGWLAGVRARRALRGCALGAGVRAFGRVQVERAGAVALGDRVTLGPGVLPVHLEAATGASLTVGADSLLEAGASLRATRAVTVGRGCWIGARVLVCDEGPRGAAPIAVEDGAIVGASAVIEPGVTIGAGAVVAPGAVVKASVPAGARVGGNPARPLELAAPPAAREGAATASAAG